MHVLNVVGARPNLMKIAPLVDALRRHSDIRQILLHTGQHYDRRMSRVFFEELCIPSPDIYLGVGSGTHATQTARVMTAFEEVLLEYRPDIVVVVGDVNSTMACAITAAKLAIPVAHVEAGLRSFDRTMPEEINRIVTDALSDLLFTPSRDADKNLQREGIPDEKIFLVGNIMIDTLHRHADAARALQTPQRYGLTQRTYALLTLHRPSNVDDPDTFSQLIDTLTIIQRDIPMLFPAHPRTMKRIEEFGLQSKLKQAHNLRLIPPQGYIHFLDLMMHARFVLTDSGGVQEETTALGIPCLTLRENTERPITISAGTNTLVGTEPARIIAASRVVLGNSATPPCLPELWDGQTAKRIVEILRAA